MLPHSAGPYARLPGKIAQPDVISVALTLPGGGTSLAEHLGSRSRNEYDRWRKTYQGAAADASNPRAGVADGVCGRGRAPLLAPLSAQAQSLPRGIPLIRDAEIEQLMRDYTQPILKAAGLAQQNIQVTLINDGRSTPSSWTAAASS